MTHQFLNHVDINAHYYEATRERTPQIMSTKTQDASR
jgi:hypothetical protein